jgi:hypothetical protein
MKARTTRFSYGLVIRVEILKKAKANGSGFFGVVPEVLHAVHQRPLEVAFVGFALGVVALGPPLAAAW